MSATSKVVTVVFIIGYWRSHVYLFRFSQIFVDLDSPSDCFGSKGSMLPFVFRCFETELWYVDLLHCVETSLFADYDLSFVLECSQTTLFFAIQFCARTRVCWTAYVTCGCSLYFGFGYFVPLGCFALLCFFYIGTGFMAPNDLYCSSFFIFNLFRLPQTISAPLFA